MVPADLAETLWKRQPALAKAHVTRVETKVDQIASVTRAVRMDRVLLVGKVDRLSVTNGTEGLLRNIVRLRD